MDEEILDYFLQLKNQYFYLPYVWAGSSPESLDQQSEVPYCPFNTLRCRIQPEGALTSGLPTLAGFDCSGFVRYAKIAVDDQRFYGAKKSVSTYVDDIGLKYKSGLDSKILDYLLLGDEVVYGVDEDNSVNWNHMGIYIGDEKILHSARVKNPYFMNEGMQEMWRTLFFKKLIKNLDQKYQHYYLENPEEVDWLRGGIITTHVLEHITPLWEKEHNTIAILKR